MLRNLTPMVKASPIHLITGATGFLGSALALEILANSDAHLLCVVRAESDAAAQQRLVQRLTATATAYARPELHAEIGSRCTALRGDIGEPGCAVRGSAGIKAQAAWHVAASLSFKLKARSSTLRHNVAGTTNTLALARALDIEEFNYISTAFVAGTRTGLILERPPGDPEATNNPYEESKIRAEMLLAEETEMTVRIFRPTIVIGHSRTHAASSYAGLYAAVNGAIEYRERNVEAMLGERPLHALGDPEARLNLIPIDVATANMWRIRQSGSRRAIFHIANATAPTVAELNETLSAAVGIRPPVLIDDESQLSALEKLIADDPRNRFQRPYLSERRHFDLTHTIEAIGEDACTFPLHGERLRPFVESHLEARAAA